MLEDVKKSASEKARRAGVISAGAVISCVGVAFLTAAAWIYLSAVLDTLLAAMIIGAAYLGVGLIMIGLGANRKQPVPPAPQPAAAPEGPPMMQAFMYGLQAGASADRR